MSSTESSSTSKNIFKNMFGYGKRGLYAFTLNQSKKLATLMRQKFLFYVSVVSEMSPASGEDRRPNSYQGSYTGSNENSKVMKIWKVGIASMILDWSDSQYSPRQSRLTIYNSHALCESPHRTLDYRRIASHMEGAKYVTISLIPGIISSIFFTIVCLTKLWAWQIDVNTTLQDWSTK